MQNDTVNQPYQHIDPIIHQWVMEHKDDNEADLDIAYAELIQQMQSMNISPIRMTRLLVLLNTYFIQIVLRAKLRDLGV